MGQDQREEKNRIFGATFSPFCALFWEIKVFLLLLLSDVICFSIVEVARDKLLLLLGRIYGKDDLVWRRGLVYV